MWFFQYIMDAEKIANLLTIPQYFDLDIYTTSRQEKVALIFLGVVLIDSSCHPILNILTISIIALVRFNEILEHELDFLGI